MRLLAGMSEINPRLKLGEQLAPLNTNRQGIILGKGLAKALHAKTGDMLMMYGTNTEGAINGIDVELLGIMSTGVSETDRYYLLTRNENAEKLLNSHKTSILALMFKNREHLEDKIRRLRSFLETDSAGAKTVLLPWYQNAAFYLSIRDIFNIIFSFMGAIILVIVLLSCWNIMNMTTMERIREIGTLRAMGLSRRQINSIFVLEAFLIGLFGAIIGMALQWILARIITALHIIMPPVPGMSRPYTLQVYGMTLLHPLVASGIIAAITLSGLSSMMIIKRYTIVESLDHS
jgi:putative ABC transport system permease protein